MNGAAIIWNMPCKMLRYDIIVMSIGSRAIAINQYRYLRCIARKREQFDQDFWSGLNLQDIMQRLQEVKARPNREIFMEGYQSLLGAGHQSLSARLEQSKSVMEIAQKSGNAAL